LAGQAFKSPGDLRETLKFLAARDHLVVVDSEVDPNLEIAGIEKALDNGPAFLFENLKGFPRARAAGNVLARMEMVAAMFGVSDHRKLKFKCLDAIKSPLPPVIADYAPSQQVVVTQNIDVPATLPIIKHTRDDAGRILGGGVVLFADPELGKTSDITFRRMHFRGKDYASIMINPVSHLIRVMRARKGDKIPVTVNIGVSPAVMLVAGVWALHMIVPDGSDEVGIAGALQGFPVGLCKARTVDAYAIADSEWVLEGYIVPDKVWESEEAEKLGKPRTAPFFPEWSGYLSRAIVTPRFQVTAVTHREDRPIFYTPLAASFEADNMSKVLREACFYEFAQRFAAGLVVDCNIPYGNKVNTGVVYKVKKRSAGDDVLLKNLLAAVLNVSMARLVVAVDDDVNIYNADEVWWAVVTRMNTRSGIIHAPVGSASTGYMVRGEGEGAEGIAFDATSPFEARQSLVRAHYPSDSVDLSRHFSREDIARIRAQQSEWARWLAEIGG